MFRIPTRIKIVLGKNQLVVPVGNPNDKVDRLLREVAARFERHGIKPGELRLASLQTVDGFIINQNDLIKDVIEHNETLIVIDYNEWIEKQKESCTTKWVQVVRPDYEDAQIPYKWIEIGVHDLNKLYVMFGQQYPGSKNEKIVGLELFDTEALQHFAKEGKVLLGSKEGEGGKWKLEAFFIVKGGTVQEVEFSAKSTSDAKPIIQRLGIIVGKKIEKGELTLIQDDKDTFDPTTYKLPLPNKTGPVLPDPPAEPQKKAAKTVVSTGDCTLVVSQKGDIEADQSSAHDGSFFNYFNHNFSLLNNSNDKLAITQVMGEYLNSKNEWVSATIRAGSRSGYYSYSWNDLTRFNMNGKDQRDLAIQIGIPVTGRQFNRNRRAHFSLPSPLKMRITFIDSANKKSEVLTEYENGPIDVTTQAEREKRNGKYYFWDQCDDTETESRFWTEAKWNEKDQRLEIYIGTGNKGTYVNYNTLKKLAYRGTKEKKEEVEFEDSYQEKDCTVKLYALIDIQNQRPYGIKSEIKTPTSSSVACFHIPIFKQ